MELETSKKQRPRPEFIFHRRLVIIIAGLICFGLFLWSFISVTIQVFNPEMAPKPKISTKIQKPKNTVKTTPATKITPTKQ
jgi:membrane protein YqaA with SNARE-associated domain